MCIPLLPLVLPLIVHASNWLGVARVLALYDTLLEAPAYLPRMRRRQCMEYSRVLDGSKSSHDHAAPTARKGGSSASDDMIRSEDKTVECGRGA